MSRSVWVAFEYEGTKRQTTVDELGDSDDIDQLRKRFKAQEELQIGASLMNVFEVGEGDQKNELEPDTGLGKYFKTDREPDEGYGPGQSKKTALWIEIPNQQELNAAAVPPASFAVLGSSEFDVQCCKLGYEFLNANDLSGYAEVARRCKDTPETIAIIDELARLSKVEHDDYSSFFCCIFSSSGTGKTQLAATASVMTRGAIYFHMSGGEEASVQSFYRPHLSLHSKMMQQQKEFAGMFPRVGEGASALSTEISNLENRNQEFSCAFVRTIAMIFKLPLHKISGIVSLQKALKELDPKPLVFLDEIPPPESVCFSRAIYFRDILRAFGIYPILMSTHTGAQNAVKIGSGSRGGNDQRWAHAFLRLPPYERSTGSVKSFLSATERPLIAHDVESCNETNLVRVIDRVRGMLQTSKPDAWTRNPVFQFCQLLRSEGSGDPGDKLWHNIVGCHFGHFKISNPSHNPIGKVKIQRNQATTWQNPVGLVAPGTEPILFLALTVWRESDLNDGNPPYFPIVNQLGVALSPRKALQSSGVHFQQSVNTANPNAIKLNGDHLEALALASMTLASLEITGNDKIGGVSLSRFLSSVLHFVSDVDLLPKGLKLIQEMIEVILQPVKFTKSLCIPPFGSADSHFCEGFGGLCWGKLSRPRDREMRDGVVEEANRTILHAECKNIKDGVSMEIMKRVIERFERNSDSGRVALLFASSLTNFFSHVDAWKDFSKKNNLDDYCFLCLQINTTPQWLTVEKGRQVLSAKMTDCEKKQFLFVIFVVGAV